MKIETLDSKKINIHDLVIESPVQAVAPFDPRLHVYEDDKENVIEWFKEQQKEGILVKTLADLVIIDPSMRARLAMGENKKINDALATILVSAIAGNDYQTVSYLKMFQPRMTNKIASNQLTWEHIQKMYMLYWDPGASSADEMEEKNNHLRNLKILFPERATEELLVDREDINWLKQSIDEQRVNKRWYDYAENLSLLRFISEEHFLQERTVGTKVWEGIHRQLESLRAAGDWERFTEFAANLTLIVADKIIITDDRFEVILPELPVDLHQPQKQLPVIREF